MHPEHSADRRRAIPQALHKHFEHSKHVVYVDAAEYHDRAAMPVPVVDRKGDVIASGSVPTVHSEVGDEVAMALALASTPAKFIVRDSETAIRNIAKGRTSPEAQKVLEKFTKSTLKGVQIICATAVSGLPGNEYAQAAARRLSFRECPDTPGLLLRTEGRDRLVTYRDITAHYRLGRNQITSGTSYIRQAAFCSVAATSV